MANSPALRARLYRHRKDTLNKWREEGWPIESRTVILVRSKVDNSVTGVIIDDRSYKLTPMDSPF